MAGSGVPGRYLDSRFHGVDAWRAALLFGGPVVHSAAIASSMHGNVEWLQVIARASHDFRMEAFFILSGFLVAISQAKNDKGWLLRRMLQLGIPFFVTWMSVVPLYLYGEALAEGRPFVWKLNNLVHLWFLMDLLLLTPLVWVGDRKGWINALQRSADGSPGVFWPAFVMTWLIIWVVVKATAYVPLFSSGLPATLAGVPYYGMFYIAGMIASRSSGVREHLASSRWWVAGPVMWVVALTFYALFYNQVIHPGNWGLHAISMALELGAAGCMSYAVLATALRMARPSRLAGALIGSAYTVYLVHMAFVGVTAWLLARDGFAEGSLFVGTSAVSLIASVAFHELVVKRSAIMMLLINGKIPFRAKPQPRC